MKYRLVIATSKPTHTKVFKHMHGHTVKMDEGHETVLYIQTMSEDNVVIALAKQTHKTVEVDRTSSFAL